MLVLGAFGDSGQKSDLWITCYKETVELPLNHGENLSDVNNVSNCSNISNSQ